MIAEKDSNQGAEDEQHASVSGEAFWLVHLFFLPRRFFTYFPTFVTRYSAAYAALVVGIANACSEVSERLVEAEQRRGMPLSDDILSSWLAYWKFCLLCGVVGALFVYRVGGWWYRVRLQWAGDAAPDAGLARKVYVFASLISAIPILVLTIVDSLQYTTPLLAETDVSDAWLVVLPAAEAWSVYCSYRGVRTLFRTTPWRARAWFLVLPILVYAGAFVAFIGYGWLQHTGVIAVHPDVSHPNKLHRAGYSLSYPGNWWIDETDEDFDLDHWFRIEPMQDALINFELVDEALDPDEQTDETAEVFRLLYEVPVVREGKAFTRWGRLAGAGIELQGRSDGVDYDIRIFSTSNRRRSMTLAQVVRADLADSVKPGFRLIEITFELRE